MLGHAREPTPTPRGFAERSGMLFVAAVPEPASPNYDALIWFVEDVLPRIEAELGYETRLTVAGFLGEGVNLDRLANHARITLRGPVTELSRLFDRHRLFVAPTRFAAGIPYKVHEAASFGLPVVTTELLRAQLGWGNGDELLSAPVNDAEGFARAVAALYRDEAVWTRLRERALARITDECDPAAFASRARAIAAGAGCRS